MEDNSKLEVSFMTIVAVDRCLALVEALAANPDGCFLAELASGLDVPQSAVHRTLAMLMDRGYVRQDPASHAYLLTLRLAAMGFRFLEARHLPDAAQTVLDRLAQDCGEYCRLSLLEDARLTWVAWAQGAAQGLRYDPPMGRDIVLHATATGKAWLATLPEADALQLVYAQGFPVPHGMNERAFGGRLVRTIDELRAELTRTRERGYALAEEEGEPGIVALAVCFRQDTACDAPVLGTISAAGPLLRLGPERRPAIAERLHVARRELSTIWPIWKRQRAQRQPPEAGQANRQIAPVPTSAES